MKYDVTITNIGSLAPNFLENSSSIILLDEGVRPNLTEMVVEHTPGELSDDIKVGDTLTMGAKRKYKVVSVGEAVNENLHGCHQRRRLDARTAYRQGQPAAAPQLGRQDHDRVRRNSEDGRKDALS